MKTSPIVSLALSALVIAVPAEAKNKSCPPGLAKKSVPCAPPGQAKKMLRGYEPGDWIGDQDYHRIRYPDRYDLQPLLPDQRYIILNNQIMVVDQNTYNVLSIVRAVSSILD